MAWILAHKLTGGGKVGMFRCGVSDIEKPRAPREWRSPQYAMNYIHEGEGYFRTSDGVSFPIRPGTVLRRTPNVTHYVCYTTPALLGVVGLPIQALELLRFSGLVQSEKPVSQMTPDFKLLKRFAELGERLSKTPEDDLSDVLVDMLALMADLHRKAKASTNQGLDPVVVRAISRLSADFSSQLTLPGLAAELGVGYSSFRKRFREQTGVSPGAFRVRRRIEMSLNMLCDGRKNVSEVARELGYPDVYTFSAQFKRMTGQSPRAWRGTRNL